MKKRYCKYCFKEIPFKKTSFYRDYCDRDCYMAKQNENRKLGECITLEGKNIHLVKKNIQLKRRLRVMEKPYKKKEEPYRFRKKLVKAGHSNYVLLPVEWLKNQAEKMKVKVIKFLDILIYEKYIEIRPSK